MHTHNAVTWFEIPAADMARASRFYGCYAHIIDTEGNRVGLHAAN